MIPFNKPFLAGREFEYMRAAVESGKLSGNGIFTQQCQHFFENHFGFPKTLLTNSGTAALEMAALLLDIGPGDEVIMPTYTFVSTANAFVLRGARIVFTDSLPGHPNMDTAVVESLITPKTKAIVCVHYGGFAVEMNALLDLCIRYHLFLVEDAAQAIGARYQGLPLGSIGHLAAFSFHETKNIQCGEGGMLVINDERFTDRAEIIWEKGTDRVAFHKKLISKYSWRDIGSSFLPSELSSAYLLAQTEQYENIRLRRRFLWERYIFCLREGEDAGHYSLPPELPGITHNHHILYLLCKSLEEREALRSHLESHGIMAAAHYQCLHSSAYYRSRHDGREMPNAAHFEACLLRLPLFHTLSEASIDEISSRVKSFYT